MIVSPIRAPIVSPIYGGIRTAFDAIAGNATQAVIELLRAAGKKAFFPSTNPATGWWQDSAGTTQAALEQPVGRITDLSGNGYHATQANSLNRPTYTQRVNQAQRTEEFSNAAWTKFNTSAVDDNVAGPTGAIDASTITATGGTAAKHIGITITLTGAQTVLFRVKAGTHTFVQIVNSGDAQMFANFNASTGATGTSGSNTAGLSATDIGNGYWQISCTFTPGTFSTGWRLYMVDSASATYAQSTSSTGTIFLAGIDIRYAAFSGMNLPAYQRVGNGTAGVADYDTAGFRPMLYFDGTSDALATSAIDLTGTDQIMALVNVLKVSDAARGLVFELSANAGTTNGASYIAAPNAVEAGYATASRGTSVVAATYVNAAVAAPNLACLRTVSDISTPVVTLRRNGTQLDTQAGSQGTGNYGNHALYIGARAGTSLWFKGYMIPGPLLDTTGIPAALLDQMAREHAATWGVAI
jgi:hypothetical protein